MNASDNFNSIGVCIKNHYIQQLKKGERIGTICLYSLWFCLR
jgi:hypothetical protein